MDIGAGEEVWKEHLMSPQGCTKNNRIDNKTSTSSISSTAGGGGLAPQTTSRQQTGATKNASRK